MATRELGLKTLLNKIIENGKLLFVNPTVFFANKEALQTYEYTVPFEYKGRPDLICLDVYDSMEHIDYLLKFNNISNPFSIDYLDVLQIPNIGGTLKTLERPKDRVDNIVRQEFLDKKKLKPKDQRRSEFLQKKYNIKEVLPPNVLKTGFKTFKFVKTEDETATVMGAQAQNPQPNIKKSKKILEKLNNISLEEAATDSKITEIASKDPEKLTKGEIAKLNKSGISVDDLKEIEKINKDAGISMEGDGVVSYDGKNASDAETVKSTIKKFDTNGNYMGTESIITSKNVDDDKLTVTETKTLIKPDGTVETTQTTTFKKADNFGKLD